MTEKKDILIVEDERIVAEDIRMNLHSLGYNILGVVSSGEDAIEKVEKNNPDLVLMDINLKGIMDGIEAADQIRSRFDIPVVYLTAYADEKTIERAKITEPFGYIIKPFDDKGLHVNIEMAIYKHKMEKNLNESKKWFSTTLMSISDAVIATDKNGFVILMNPVAEELTGWTQEYAFGKPLKSIYNVSGNNLSKSIMDPASKAILGGPIFTRQNESILKSKDGRLTPVEESCSPIKDDKENVLGIVIVFRDMTERKQAEETLIRQAEELEKANIELKCAFNGLFKRLEQKYKSQSTQQGNIINDIRGGIFLYPIENEVQARNLFISMYDAGLPTLAVVRTPPHRFKKLLTKEVETIWLTMNRTSEGVCLNPSNITRLSMVLTEFFKRAPNGVVFFEGIEYLLSIVGFQDILGLIQILNDKIALTKGTIYIIIDMGVLDSKQIRFIKRECLSPMNKNEN